MPSFMPSPRPAIVLIGIEFLNERGLEPGTPLGYIGRTLGIVTLSKLPEIADANGSSKDDD